MTRGLEGKVAFVTGSGRGPGHAVAFRLAELGANVAVHDMTWDAPAKHGESARLRDVAQVNAVSPGPTKTARFQATRTVDAGKMDATQKPLVRYAEPSEIADAVAFLAGHGGRFVNGQVLRVDGGHTLFPG